MICYVVFFFSPPFNARAQILDQKNSKIIYDNSILESKLLKNISIKRKLNPITIGVKNSNLKIIITDDGTGFSKDIIDKLGEPYISKNTEGMGLGIFISKNLIENMGGKLVFYNSKDENAVVEIVFDNSIFNI